MSDIFFHYLKEEYGLDRKDNHVNLNDLFEKLGLKEAKTFVNILERVIEGKDFSINEARMLLHITCKSFFKIFDEYLKNFVVPYGSDVTVAKIVRNLFNKILFTLIQKNEDGEKQNTDRRKIALNGTGYTIINNKIFHETKKKIGIRGVYINRETRKKNIFTDDNYNFLLFSSDIFPDGGVDEIYGISKFGDKEYIKFSNSNKENFIDFEGNLLFSSDKFIDGGVDKIEGKAILNNVLYIKFFNNNKENFIDFEGNLLFSSDKFIDGGVDKFNKILKFENIDYVLFTHKNKINNNKSLGNLSPGVVNVGGNLKYANKGSKKFTINSKMNLLGKDGNLFFTFNDYPEGGVDNIDSNIVIINNIHYIRIIDKSQEFFINFEGKKFIKKDKFFPFGGYTEEDNKEKNIPEQNIPEGYDSEKIKKQKKFYLKEVK